MSETVPLCTHVKTDGVRCGSPAVSGTGFCYHHSAVKTALRKASSGQVANGEFAPIPFVFPEDRASMQINFFLLMQAYNEQRMDQRTYNSMLSLLKAMSRNLGKSGSLVEDREQGSERRAQEKRGQGAETGDQRDRTQSSGHRAQEKLVSKADGLESLVDLKASAIAPESCFSKNPQIQGMYLTDLFRMSPLDRQDYARPARPLTL